MRQRLEEALWRLPNKFYARLDKLCHRLRETPEAIMTKSLDLFERTLENDPSKAPSAVRAYFSKVAKAGAKKMGKRARVERARKAAEAMHARRREREAAAKEGKPTKKRS